MGIDIGRLKEKFDKKTADRADRLNFKDGDNYIRILPPSLEYLSENVDYISYEYLMHFQIGMEGSKSSEVCPKTIGKQAKCPVCEATFKLYKTNTAEDRALASDLRAKHRFIFNVIDLNDIEKGIQIMEVGPAIYDDLVMFVTNPKWGDLLDLDKGRNITITKTPKNESSSGYVEYKVAPDPEMTSVRSKLPKNFKEVIGLLKKSVPTAKSYEELLAILQGEEPTEKPIKTVEKDVSYEELNEEEVEKVLEEEPKKEEIQKKHDQNPPKCFGEDYGPKREECMKCNIMINCRKKFLEV